ncbi:MAG: hypothetical protein EA384_05745 [Spirochaetaceae bacterium]|nr:MAG: hypothetical protein EA384_05745 [Spirochaetaceae bacterium]
MSRMLKAMAACAILIGAVGILPASEHVPSYPGSRIELQTHLRAFWNLGDWEPMVSLDGRVEDGFELFYRSLTLGTYYRLHRNLKVGGFYRAQQGARHDDDWVATGGSFDWDDTGSRTEHLFFADVSPRVLLDMLPGENWVLMLKSRYFYNSFNRQQWLTVRPGLTWFWIVDREPQLNVSGNYEFYIPLNFGETVLYGHGPYLNVLYHLSPTVKLDATAAYRTRTWSTSEDVEDDPAHGDYQKTVRTWLLGLGVIFRF